MNVQPISLKWKIKTEAVSPIGSESWGGILPTRMEEKDNDFLGENFLEVSRAGGWSYPCNSRREQRCMFCGRICEVRGGVLWCEMGLYILRASGFNNRTYPAFFFYIHRCFLLPLLVFLSYVFFITTTTNWCGVVWLWSFSCS